MIVWNSVSALPRTAQKDPLTSGEYLLRDDDVKIEPPPFNADTHICTFDGDKWVVALIPEPESEEPELDPIPAIDQLRYQRNNLLTQTDWEIIRALETGSDATALKNYRQKLRDLPANSTPSLNENGELTNVTWPIKP